MNKFIKPLIILVVLVALWLIVRYTSENPSRPNPEVSLILKVSPEEIKRLEIFRGAEKLILLKGTSSWQVQTPAGVKPAESEQVESALKSLGEISTTDIVSHNPQKHAEYKVDDTTGTHVRLIGQGDKMLEDIILGKLGGFESQQMAMQRGQINERDFYTFMRRQGKNEVFKVQGFFGGMLGTDSEQWRDHTLMSFSPEKASKVTLTYPDEKVVLAKDTSGTWAMIEPQAGAKVDSLAVEKMVSTLSTLRASGFIDSTIASPVLGLDTPALRIEVSLNDGTLFEVSVGSETGNNLFYCQRPNDQQLYTLAAYRLDQVKKRAADLIKKEGT